MFVLQIDEEAVAIERAISDAAVAARAVEAAEAAEVERLRLEYLLEWYPQPRLGGRFELLGSFQQSIDEMEPSIIQLIERRERTGDVWSEYKGQLDDKIPVDDLNMPNYVDLISLGHIRRFLERVGGIDKER